MGENLDDLGLDDDFLGTISMKEIINKLDFSGHEFEQTPEVGEGLGRLGAVVHGVAESDVNERLNNNHRMQNGAATLEDTLVIFFTQLTILFSYELPIAPLGIYS